MIIQLFRFLIYTAALAVFFVSAVHGQFLERFEDEPVSEWITITGDGDAVSSLEWHSEFARFVVDATNDRQNVWWAIMRTNSIDVLDQNKLAEPGYELRMEARVRSSHAPRRLNMHLRTQRTVNNYSNLMEFDIPDKDNWHTIRMTTRQMDVRPGDSISAHIALMDWGPLVYKLDVDYVKIDVIKKTEAEADLGEQVVYPPPVPKPDEFAISHSAIEAGMIDESYPDVNFSGWIAGDEPVLTIDSSKIILLRWDLTRYSGKKAAAYGMLELTPHSSYKTTGTGEIEFDRIRLVEITGGDANWTRNKVTFNSFKGKESIKTVLNTQMIIDIDIPDQKNSSRYIHIPRPVIQRLLDGQTKGIALYPLGALHASFYPGGGDDDPIRPKLYFNISE